MLIPAAALLVGLAVLVWSSERFIEGAVGTAHHLHLPSFLIGSVIVGVGTSAPEFLISGLSAWHGQPGLAIGNAYGSNIANIALVLGVALLLSPIPVAAGVARREIALLVAVTLLSRWLIDDGAISRLDASLLLLPLIGYLALVAIEARRAGQSATAAPTIDPEPEVAPLGRSLLWLILGLLLLVASSRLLVWGASTIATALGVSDLVIGLTVVAVGTSLPELASSISAVRRKAYALVLGNVVGSNLFNTLGVVGIAGLINSIEIEPSVRHRDWPIMLALTVLLWLCAIRFGRPSAQLNRTQGGIFVLAFIVYTAWLVIGAFAATE
ncbi:K+-dependent Na+/Ca+ exchanger-like protein [Salinisphaera sp. T5B8]|uniref:calcium/sodium antiporter n=1 Tax=Salinisphaera sp. T5B8 TaxID=1304154 RepID=UPI00333E8B03